MLYYGSHRKLKHISNFQWFNPIQLEFSSCLLRETVKRRRRQRRREDATHPAR